MKKTLSFLFLAALSTLVYSAEVTKSLKLPAEGIARLSVDAGAGSLDIRGEEGLSSIEVGAEIIVDGISEKKLDDFLKDHLRFSVEKNGGESVL